MPIYVTLTCEACLQSFHVQQWELKQRTPRYCSMRCMGEAKRKAQETRQCAHCGAVFTLRKDNQQRANRRYCSLDCANKATGKAKARALADRLWSSVDRCEHGEDCPYCCWVWTGAVGTTRYGKITEGRKTLLAHRVAWEVWNNRPFPSALDGAHYCHNRRCCNPWHVRPATVQENLADAVRDNRILRWSRSGMSKLTEESVRQIFALAKKGLSAPKILAHLAKHAGVILQSETTIQAVLRRKTWRHVSLDVDASPPTAQMPRPIKIDRLAIYARDRGICHICHKHVPQDAFSIDHLIPKIVGGNDETFNLAVAHLTCNQQRQTGKRIYAQLRLF